MGPRGEIQGRKEAFFASALSKTEQQQAERAAAQADARVRGERAAVRALASTRRLGYTSAVRSPALPVRGPSAWNGSGSRRPSTQSAMYSRERGAVLEPVARAAAEQPPRVALGVASRTGSGVSRVRSYWQTRAPTIGASASAGKRRAVYSRARCSSAGRGSRSSRVGVDLVAAAVRCDLRAEPADLAVAVEPLVVLAEPRRAAPGAVGGEEEDVAPRDANVDELREIASAATPRRPRRRRRRGARRRRVACPVWNRTP